MKFFRTTLIALLAVCVSGVAHAAETETQPDAHIGGARPPAALMDLPEVRDRKAADRLDLVLQYETAHTPETVTRGEFQKLNLTTKESLVYVGLLWYDMSNAVTDINRTENPLSQDDLETSREFIIETLLALRDGLVSDMGAPLDDAAFLADAADFVENLPLDKPEELAKLEPVLAATEKALMQFVTEEFGIPLLTFLQYGYWLADVYSVLDVCNAAQNLELPEDLRKQAMDYLKTQVTGATNYYQAINGDARVVNAVKKAMSNIAGLQNVDESALADMLEDVKIILSAVVGGAFEKESSG